VCEVCLLNRDSSAMFMGISKVLQCVLVATERRFFPANRFLAHPSLCVAFNVPSISSVYRSQRLQLVLTSHLAALVRLQWRRT
jgi:hypothetical protein